MDGRVVLERESTQPPKVVRKMEAQLHCFDLCLSRADCCSTVIICLIIILTSKSLISVPRENSAKYQYVSHTVQTLPTTNGGMQNGSSCWNMYTLHTRFCTFGRQFVCSVGAYQQKCLHRSSVGKASVVGWADVLWH